MRVAASNTAESTGLQMVTDSMYESTGAIECPVFEKNDVEVEIAQTGSDNANVTYLKVSFEDTRHEYLAIELYELTVV